MRGERHPFCHLHVRIMLFPSPFGFGWHSTDNNGKLEQSVSLVCCGRRQHPYPKRMPQWWQAFFLPWLQWCTITWRTLSFVYFVLRWLKNGLPLEDQILPGDEQRVVISNNVLTFTSLDDEKDNGMYQCAATNTHGTRYSSAELRVLSKCHSSSGAARLELHGATQHISHLALIYASPRTKQIQRECTRNSALFCSNQDIFRSKTFFSFSGFPPNFEKYPLQVNQFATQGGNTTIMCRPEAAPTPEITW